MKTRVGIIFGGRSGEHEISIRSAGTVIEQIDHEKYDVLPIAITNEGVWMNASDSLGLFPQETRVMFRERFAPVSGEQAAGSSGLLSVVSRCIDSNVELSSDRNSQLPILNSQLDVVFPVLHGTYGEDGTVQGLFEMADLPYVGCGVLASSCGMDKAFMKTLFRDAGLPICNYVWFLRDEWARARETVLSQVETKLGFPCFVKPANLGSSVGVSRADDAESLASAISLAAEYDRKIIVEEAIEMREIECAVMGNDVPEASLPGEYLIRDDSKKFLDYTEKYSGTGNNEFVVPAPVSDELSAKIRQMAITAFKAIDGAGLARVDFFLRSDNGALLVNEINTMPGLTDASGFPKMWEGTGKAMPQVIDELIEFAIARYEDKNRNRTDRG